MTLTAVSAGVVVIATTVLGSPAARAADAPADAVQYGQIALASTSEAQSAEGNVPPAGLNPFDTSLKWLLDTMGVGEKTPAQMFAPDLTVGQLLGGSSTSTVTVDTELHIDQTLNMLGLQNITLADVMNALNLPPAETVDEALSTMQILDTKLDVILTPLGLPSTQTLLGVEDHFSVSNITVAQLLPILGFNINETAQTVWNFWGIPSGMQSMIGIGFGILGVSNNSTIGELIQKIQVATLPGGTLSGDDTLGEVLQADTMPDGRPLSEYTIGEALGFNSSTTIRQFIDNLHINIAGDSVGPSETVGDLGALPTLGSTTLGSLLSWANLPPTESLAQLIDNLQIHNVPAGSLTIGDALDGLIVNPSALATSTVQDSTPVVDLLNAMSWGTYTIDQMLNLAP